MPGSAVLKKRTHFCLLLTTYIACVVGASEINGCKKERARPATQATTYRNRKKAAKKLAKKLFCSYM